MSAFGRPCGAHWCTPMLAANAASLPPEGAQAPPGRPKAFAPFIMEGVRDATKWLVWGRAPRRLRAAVRRSLDHPPR
jgi:hypothetical protein